MNLYTCVNLGGLQRMSPALYSGCGMSLEWVLGFHPCFLCIWRRVSHVGLLTIPGNTTDILGSGL